jgi:hypothetical protein
VRSREIPKREKRVPEAALRHDPQVKAWVRRLAGDPEAVPSDLSPQKLAFVMEEVMKRRGEEFDRTLYEKHMERLRPGLAMPAVTDQVEDMRAVFSVGEFREFWAAWTGRRGERGPAANVEGAKALMATMAVPGMTTHAVDAHELLDGHARLQGVFSELAEDTSPDGGPFELPGYSSGLRIAHKIAPRARWEACKQTVALVRWLREHVPGFEQAGKRLLIDGTSIVAWAPQRGYGKDDPREAALREHTRRPGSGSTSTRPRARSRARR